jgi:hypothetical protein
MTETIFTPADLEDLSRRGVAAKEAGRQIEYLKNPPAAVVLHRPCTIGDGIVRIEPHDHDALVDQGDAVALAGRVTKFVPASGAATRMFQDLIARLEDLRRPSDSPAARELFENLDAFAFGEEVRRRTGIENEPSSEAEERIILRTVLEEMGYARIPKGLIPFHFGESPRTAFEEHLLEGTRYARAHDGTVRMHFTVAPEARADFEGLLGVQAPAIEQRRGSVLDVTFSEQHPSTDTVSIDEKGEPFRKSDGTLLFRPGGHGALLRNLEATGGDIVSIKNIDNILPDETSTEVVRWKQTLIGFLARIQQEVFAFLSACSEESAPEEVIDRAIAFAAFRFSRTPHVRVETRDAKRAFIIEALDRPLRVCGVVKNEGEPGGAPFWIEEPDGTQSVQIVEFSQVDPGNPEQVKIFESSTHFNPVDIICGLRSWRDEPFDLDRFVDHRAVFISRKSYEGRALVALERPGLWNGAMAHWNTICVEVPGSTFAPVKTVLDLLRPQHQFRPARGGRRVVEIERCECQDARLMSVGGFVVSRWYHPVTRGRRIGRERCGIRPHCDIHG